MMDSDSRSEVTQQEVNLTSHEESVDHDYAYYGWFGLGLATSFAAIFTHGNHEVLGKVAWTVIGPGFTLSQVWKELDDLKAYAVFATFLLFHLVLMQVVFPALPSGRMGYILIAGITEIMTVGLAVQVWLRCRER